MTGYVIFLLFFILIMGFFFLTLRQESRVAGQIEADIVKLIQAQGGSQIEIVQNKNKSTPRILTFAVTFVNQLGVRQQREALLRLAERRAGEHQLFWDYPLTETIFLDDSASDRDLKTGR